MTRQSSDNEIVAASTHVVVVCSCGGEASILPGETGVCPSCTRAYLLDGDGHVVPRQFDAAGGVPMSY